MISRKTSGLQYLEQYELLSSRLLKWCQFLGTAPYPLDLRSFLEPHSVSQSSEILFRVLQTALIATICIYYALSMYPMLFQAYDFKLYSFVLFFLSYVFNGICIPLVFLGCRLLKNRYREISTKIGGILYAYQLQGFELNTGKLWKWHRNLLIGSGIILSVMIVLKKCDKHSKDPFLAMGVDLLPEVIAVSCLCQYFYAMTLIRLVLRFSSIMMDDLKTRIEKETLLKQKILFLLRKLRTVIDLSNEIDRIFGPFVLLQLILIIVVGSRVLWCAAWFYDLKSPEPSDIYYLVYSLLLGLIQGLKLVLLTYPHYKIQREMQNIGIKTCILDHNELFDLILKLSKLTMMLQNGDKTCGILLVNMTIIPKIIAISITNFITDLQLGGHSL